MAKLYKHNWQIEVEDLGRRETVSEPVAVMRILNYPALLEAIRCLADASEAYASSDPDMPSHKETETEFDAALAAARTIIG